MNRLILVIVLLAMSAVTTLAQTPTPPPASNPDKARADRLQARLTDFPTLARYREANMKLGTPAKGEDRVVFFGDSITDSWKLDQYFPGQPYVNRGISGQSTYHMLLRFRPDVIDLKPKVVVILAGTNDIASTTEKFKLDTIKSNLLSIVDLAQVNGIGVVLASVMPVSDYNKDSSGNPVIRTVLRPPAMINELNAWIKDLCGKRGLVYLDYFTAMADEKGMLKADISKDGLHPNEKGYAIMKPLAEAAIKTALINKTR
ncbi:MAG: SGNH/GDSL hydrolase family protein [Pyrinomonadaceae bacterium]|nr:SGNH/GDSL hydrolase family protein [Chloracidobacterium sp.]